MTKEPRLSAELRRIVALDDFVDYLRRRDTTYRDIHAMRRLLNSRKGKQSTDARVRYSDELLLDARNTIHREMQVLKNAGQPQSGPKSAIRSWIEKTRQSLGKNRSDDERIENAVDYLFKIYDAARKRI